jgi:probable rRNA maturation factor
MPNDVNIINKQRKYLIDADGLSLSVGLILDLLQTEDCQLSVAFVSSDRIRALNREFRGRDEVTDVLSFPSQDSQDPAYLGDIAVCPSVIARQAGRDWQDGRPVTSTPREELALMLIHSVLHLVGYDHEGSAARRKAMIRREHSLYPQVIEFFPEFH